MDKEVNMSAVVDEIKNANEDELREVITKWFESTRTDGLKLGAKMVSLATVEIIKKHLRKTTKPSLRDYQRCVDEILKILSVQLVEQNDSEKVVSNETVEEATNDGTTE